MFEDILSAFYFILPLYLINILLLLLGSKHLLDTPLISARWFGKHRSWKGVLLITSLSPVLFYLTLGDAYLGIVMGLGMVLGNLGSSFIKRILNLAEGTPLPILDQLDFVLGAALSFLLVYGRIFDYFLIICLLTLILHPLSNIIAYLLKIKRVWW